MLTELAHTLLDVIFPPRCVRCRAPGAVICVACLSMASAPPPPLCSKCGRSIPSGHAVCPSCAAGYGPKALSAIRAAVVHDGAVRDGVLALKYRGQRRLAEPLGVLLAAAIQSSGYLPDVIVPVPLHAARRRARGYNQAELLAWSVARRLRVPCETQVLVRRRATPPQVGLSSAERRINVVDAFEIVAPKARRIAGRRVLLLDDVTTTGSTLDAAATALLAATPAEVRGFALTRPDSSDDSRDADWSANGRAHVMSPQAEPRRGRAP